MTEIPELSDLLVIFISAYGRDETVARALDAGAADYIVKPFSPTELTARVRAALRRRERPATFELDGLAIDYESRRVPRWRGPRDEPHRDRVPAPAGAFAQRRTGRPLRHAAPPGVERAGARRPEPGAHRRQEPPPQARRGRRAPGPGSSTSAASDTACRIRANGNPDPAAAPEAAGSRSVHPGRSHHKTSAVVGRRGTLDTRGIRRYSSRPPTGGNAIEQARAVVRVAEAASLSRADIAVSAVFSAVAAPGPGRSA